MIYYIVGDVISITELKAHVKKVAQMYGLKKVVLFGSYANGKRTAKSDIDILVEFNEPIVSYLKIIGVKHRLEEMTGKGVDVVLAPVPNNSLIEIDKEIMLYGA